MSANPKRTSSSGQEPGAPEGRLYLREEELDRAVALFFRATRNFWKVAQSALDQYGLGAAHYRALAAIRRNEGLSVTELLATLGVRKQSLQRVLGELEDNDFVVREQGEKDRRERRLRLTARGREAERLASAALRERIGAVFRGAGAEAVAGARSVLLDLAETGAERDD